MSDSVSMSDFKKGGEKSQEAPHPRWWLMDGKEAANAIGATISSLQEYQRERIRNYVICARFYGNMATMGLGGLTASSMTASAGMASAERLTDNVIQSLVDTATAHIGENRPRPYFLSNGGDYRLQRKAKRLNKLVDGLFYEQDAYGIGRDTQRDCEIWGDGFQHVFACNGRVKFERVLPMELWVDEMEAAYGFPRQMHWVRAVDRLQLIDRFPDAEEAIMRSAASKVLDAGSRYVADMVTVRESWHLPSGPEAKDGRHCISIDGDLIDPMLEWEHDCFPFARFRWHSRPFGYWSQGIAERQMNKQLQINKLQWLFQRSAHMAGSFKMLLPVGSKVVKEHLNNDVGTIITYAGNSPPSYVLPQVMPPEYYAQRDQIASSMYAREGLAEPIATGEKPIGLNSGEAQRVYRDGASQRLKTAESNNESAYIELARLAIMVAKDIAKEKGGYKVQVPERGRAVEMKFTASELDFADWRLQCFPTSSLPKDPEGRLETITEYIQAGFMTQRQGRRALDFPDLETVESLANAQEDALTRKLDAILDGDEYEPPWPTDDLQMALELVTEYIARGQMQNLEDDQMEGLFTWKAQVESLLAEAQQAAQPPPGAPGQQGPMAVPMQRPVSPILPVAS